MKSIYNEVFKAISYLLIAGLVSLVYEIARNNAKGYQLIAEAICNTINNPKPTP
jgi:hypothetical protein